MTDIIILPGIGGSGEDHWQTLWQQAEPSMRRFAPANFDEPELGDWLDALDAAVAEATSPPILVAHSLACLLVAHWSARAGTRVAGALLVSVPDPAGPKFPRAAAGFADVPTRPLAFPSLMVASSDDPYGSLAYMRLCARNWGSRIVEVGPLGHINSASGVGAWDFGRALVAEVTAARVAA